MNPDPKPPGPVNFSGKLLRRSFNGGTTCRKGHPLLLQAGGGTSLNLRAPLNKGDSIHILGHTTDLKEAVDSMEIDNQPIDLAQPGEDVAIKVAGKVRDGDKVYRELEDGGSFTVRDL